VIISAIQGTWAGLPAKPPAEQRPVAATATVPVRADSATIPPVQPLPRDPVAPVLRKSTAGPSDAANPPLPDLQFPDPLPDLPKIDLPEPRPAGYAAARDILQSGRLPPGLPPTLPPGQLR
jgi:hypothetical protein